jgi:hypothetical protein
MKKTLAAAVIAAFLPSVSYAATLNFPSDTPIASITIPDYWGTKGMQEQHGPELQAIIASLKPAE